MVPRAVVLITAVLFCVNTVKVSSATVGQRPKANVDADWWKNAVIYQIYPRSFKDNIKDDGIGDIQGIISKLSHLKDAGVTAAWLSPIYKSPQVDQGYDISDYKDIDEDYGTIDDFKAMVVEAQNLGIKIVMDFVPNHSSNEHEWFIKSENREEGYEDYYIWKAGDPDTPPNNWVSLFKGPAWSYSDIRKQWYLHQFAPEQPDLNYRNPKVKEQMQDVLKFWLDLGVDGFRMDAVPYLIEDESFGNEPPSGDPNAQPGDHEYLNHTLTSDQDGTYAIIYDWREFIDKYNKEHITESQRIMMTEAYTTLENTMKYYTDGTREGAHFTFNFLFITDLTKTSTAQDIIAVVERWMNAMPKGCVANWVLGNHDNHRVATRFGPERVDGLNILIAFLPGVMVTYNGEEIGMENGKVTKADCQDPRACKFPTEEEYQAVSRDFERTPFHWDATPNAGFNTGAKPWLPVSDKYVDNNLVQQTATEKSHYQLYKDLLKLRQQPGFGEASVKYAAPTSNVIAFTKSIQDGKTYVVVINIGDKQEKVDLSSFPELNQYLGIHIADSHSKKEQYSIIPVNSIVLEPYESFVALSLGDADWWKHAVIYQIYPLSFKDHDNSGEGDLQGIISKLEHLKDAGVTAAWLSPIFKTPNKDQGYDISDFRDIEAKFGNMTDFKMLIEKAHQLGIKIVLDFVPNHSSNQHDWFVKSESKVAGYEDYYVWRDCTLWTVPNNWKSIFGGSAWQYSTKRRQCYLHQFLKEQPDLNYRSSNVVTAMKDVLKFWLDQGVDGFRLDAVPYIFEDEEFKDEPIIEGLPGTEHGHLEHIYTSDQDGTFDMIYQWRDLVKKYAAQYGGDARVLMTEAYTDISNTMKYYGDENGREGAHFTFNFQMITKLNKESTAKNIVDAVLEWQDNMPEQYTANWVLGNHDNHRVATRFGPENADGFNMLIGVLPGVMVTYNGEEIGQENGEVSFEEGVDASACGNKTEFPTKSRDFERTPFHWDTSINAGFNEGTKTWLPVSKNYKINNLASQTDPKRQSHYQVYKQLLELRREPAFIRGKLTIEALTPTVVSCIRSLEGNASYIHLFNVGNTVQVVQAETSVGSPYLKVVLADSLSLRRNGELIASANLTLGPHESIIAMKTDEVPVITQKPDDKDDGVSRMTVSFVALFVGLFCALVRY